HDEECECGHHHHHDHDEECECGHHHHHDHDEECECGHHHHHDHDEECECGHHHHHDHDDECSCGHHHHHADEVFSSWGTETVRKFTEDEIKNILASFTDENNYGFILRAKGIVPAADGKWIHFDYVPDEYNVRFGGADVTGRLVVIGTNVDEVKLEALFKNKN
ncbi:MAG: GTP-binding protein, partial [Oscillospiraceae bacterium]|nr:GTP-binding protein [Oscillospiraceae bacterium]